MYIMPTSSVPCTMRFVSLFFYSVQVVATQAAYCCTSREHYVLGRIVRPGGLSPYAVSLTVLVRYCYWANVSDGAHLTRSRATRSCRRRATHENLTNTSSASASRPPQLLFVCLHVLQYMILSERTDVNLRPRQPELNRGRDCSMAVLVIMVSILTSSMILDYGHRCGPGVKRTYDTSGWKEYPAHPTSKSCQFEVPSICARGCRTQRHSLVTPSRPMPLPCGVRRARLVASSEWDCWRHHS